MTNNNDGLISALLLDGKGGCSELDWAGVQSHWDDDNMVWLHLDYTHEKTQKWLCESSGLDALMCDALLSEETRPRSVAVSDGLLVNLRGISLSPGSDPEDMISLRFWIEQNRLITLLQHKQKAVEDTRQTLKEGHGPKNAMELLLGLTEKMVDYTGDVVDQLEEEIDLLEEEVLTHETYDLRSRIAKARRSTIGIRRYLAPQREAMFHLYSENVSWIQERERARLREIADRVTRYVEDLDLIRDRAAVTQEELASRLAEQTNRTMYVLSVVAGIFLPLGLITGLLGINVGGVPGTNNPWAFWIVCFLLVVITFLETLLFRRKKWL